MAAESTGVKKILIVCTGNLCRSPMAAALLRRRLSALGLDGAVTVESAGTHAQPGDQAAGLARAAMREHGLSLEEHRARPVTEAMLDEADLVIVMEEAQRRYLFHLSMKNLRKVYLLTELSGGGEDVRDPTPGTYAGYARTAGQIGSLLEAGMPRILKLLQLDAT